MRNASAFLFDRKFHFLSNKKDVDAHSRNVDVAWRQPRSARVCALAHTFLYPNYVVGNSLLLEDCQFSLMAGKHDNLAAVGFCKPL